MNSENVSDIVKLNENIELKEGVLKINTKNAFTNLYEEIKNKGSESYYNEKIRKFENFKPLRPYFYESETNKFKEFLAKKKKKKKNQSKNYHKVNNCEQFKSNKETFELDDDIIIDNDFSILLNEDREIIVEGILYRYQEDGVFQVEVERIEEFRTYISGETGQKKSYTEEDFGFQRMDYTIQVYEDCSYGGGGSGGGNSFTEPDFYKAKHNFHTAEFSKNPSLWGKAFGYARTEIVNVPDNKRMKLKFWNRNYVLFKSFGTEIRFQKEVSFLGISGWQKSYPDKIALGINHLQYNFERGVGNHLNNSFFHQKIYTYKGYHYFSDGTTSYTPPPNVAFPLAETLGLNEGLKLTRIFPYTDFSFKINITQHENANLINKAGSALLDFGVKKIPSIFSIPTENPSLFKIDFFKNAVSVEVDNKNWRAETENNITKYLDVSVPSISITADIGANGESFFSNPNLNFPNLDFETYKTSSVDFYGAVLYENVWYGKRMISNDFKRK